MKILVLIPVYKRPEVFQICAKYLNWFKGRVKWQIEVVCILSPEDIYLKDNERTCKKYGFKRVYFHNLPVGNKLNAGINYVMSHYEFNYLMNFGSDDVIHPDIEVLYEPYFNKNFKFFGINTLYFHDLDRNKTIFFDTYNTNGSIGAGRMIHQSILQEFSRNMLPVYEPDLNCGLDTSSAMSIKRLLSIPDVIIDSGEFPYVIDIKTNTNINLFEHIETRTRNCQEVKEDIIAKHFNI
jgi:hypothetical protein